MKRVLCLISSVNAGGAETFLMKIYRELDKGRFQMDFCINTIDKCFYEDEIIHLGGRIYRIPSKSNSIKEFKKNLGSIIKTNNYDIVLRILSNSIGMMDLKIAKKNGAKRCIARSSNSSDGLSLKMAILNYIGRILYSGYVDIRIAPSDLAARYTFGNIAYFNNNVEILHNGLDIETYKYNKNNRKQIRNIFKLNDNVRVIGHIGRFVFQKNHSFLIDIFNKIYHEDSSAILMLVGVGELEQEIKDKIKKLSLEKNVIFTGLRDDIPSILSAMDVFVFPSFYEGMPNTVIEAQASGLPCVISDTITREANITGLVKYISLNSSAEVWAKEALEIIDTERHNTKNAFIKNQYDIETVTNKFTKLVFGDISE